MNEFVSVSLLALPFHPNQIIHGGKRKGLPESEAQFYAAGIAEGLGYMHRRGYVYRDLKPENVLIGSDGYSVIVDFGFAKYVSDKVSWGMCLAVRNVLEI
jgi:serine/threonine protein kinase